MKTLSSFFAGAAFLAAGVTLAAVATPAGSAQSFASYVAPQGNGNYSVASYVAPQGNGNYSVASYVAPQGNGNYSVAAVDAGPTGRYSIAAADPVTKYGSSTVNTPTA